MAPRAALFRTRAAKALAPLFHTRAEAALVPMFCLRAAVLPVAPGRTRRL